MFSRVFLQVDDVYFPILSGDRMGPILPLRDPFHPPKSDIFVPGFSRIGSEVVADLLSPKKNNMKTGNLKQPKPQIVVSMGSKYWL